VAPRGRESVACMLRMRPRAGGGSLMGGSTAAKIVVVPYNFVPAGRDQQFLMPPSLLEWLPESHLA